MTVFDNRVRKNLDLPLLALIYTIALLGIVTLFSATRTDPTAVYKKQAMFVVAGTLLMVGTAALNYRQWGRFAGQLYTLNLLLLALVLKFAPGINGAARWIKIGPVQFQPSEFAKFTVIITLAVFLTKRQETIRDPKTLILSFLYVAVPMAFIFKQPDLGTTLVILAIWFGMTYMAGAKLLHLGAFVLAGVLLFTGMWHTGKIKDFQKARLISFLNPEADPKETGYHVIQARIAIGSGGMWGKGLLKSTQVRGGYIPEKQTDFIFTTIGEELGFVGATVLIALYGFLLLRGMVIVAAAGDDLTGKLIATGIVAMFAFHIIVNIAMNIGILPVTGVPLLLVSAGGSNVLLTLTCVGLLQSIVIHCHKTLFD